MILVIHQFQAMFWFFISGIRACSIDGLLFAEPSCSEAMACNYSVVSAISTPNNSVTTLKSIIFLGIGLNWPTLNLVSADMG